MNERMTFPLELKELSENGEFIGIASPYGIKDLGDDIVERGAFTKSIAERGNKVRLLDSHQTRIGIAEVSESQTGLMAKGRINLDKQIGRDAYSDLKFYQSAGQPMGLSIGFQTVKSDIGDKGVRLLKELKLFEISVTEIPMNESALVTAVKDARFEFADIAEEMKAARIEKKAGRKISAESRRKLEAAMKEIMALLEDEAADNGTSDEGAAEKAIEPEALHSVATTLRELRALIPGGNANGN
jgi:HK97 family phage prohead protease